MVRRVGVGVVGLGMGRSHARAFHGYEKARLVALCDIRSDILKKTCEEFGAKPYNSYHDMLQDPEIEAVAIATPSYEHAPMAIYAALHGKHVLVEKPIATDLTAADRMIKICKEQGVKLGCVFQSRLDPINMKMKKAVDEGRLGRIFLIEGIVKWWRSDKDYYHENKMVEMWKGTWFGEGGGALANQGIHTMDQLYWMMGDADTVYGQYDTVGHSIQAEDFSAALIRFKNGAVGYIVSTTCLTPRDLQETRLTIHGTKGTISRVGNQLIWRIEGEPAETIAGETLKSDTLTVAPGGPHAWQCRDFIDSILEDRNPVVTGESAIKALELVKAVYESALQGKPAKLPLPRY